jgi:AhpD family alkylhydroperoxidase
MRRNAMTFRVDQAQQSPDIYKKFIEFSLLLNKSAIEKGLRDLINIRVSQINGCAFCFDMHTKEAKLHGERELRLYHVGIWRESTLFSARERAALTWAEVLTTLPPHGVADADYEAVSAVFSEKEVSDLTFCVMAINAWNRAGVGLRKIPGSQDAAFGLDKAGLN